MIEENESLNSNNKEIYEDNNYSKKSANYGNSPSNFLK